MADNVRMRLPFAGKTAERLISVFGSEENALHAIRETRMAELASIQGIGVKTALQIIQKYWGMVERVTPRSTLLTNDIQHLYRDLWKIIRSFFRTEFGRAKLDLFFPLPMSKYDEIRRREIVFQEAKQVAESLSDSAVERIQNALGHAKILKLVVSPSRISGRVILCDDPVISEDMKKKRLDRYCPIYTISPNDKVRDYLSGYDQVVFVHNKNRLYDSAIDYADNVVMLDMEGGRLLAVPEFFLALFVDNLETIRAACEFAEELNQLPQGPQIQAFKTQVDLNSLREIRRLLTQIQQDGTITKGINKDVDRFGEATRNFDMILAEVEVTTNERITKAVQERAITIQGEQVLKILQAATDGDVNAGRLKSYLPPEISDIVLDALDNAETMLASKLGLTSKEVDWVEGIIVRSVGLPIQINKKETEVLFNTIRQRFTMAEYKVKLDLARRLIPMRQVVNRAVQAMLELDFFLGIGLFEKEFKLDLPKIDPSQHGIGFTGARNIFLVEQNVEVTPIDYIVGEAKLAPLGTDGERVILLSGANSGGKTCLLQTLLQILILGQSGFLVPAHYCEIGVFDELYYYAKAEGMLSAGAFETSIKRLADIILKPSRKFACFDEWEAATEAEAAARIVATVLDIFYERPESCVIFVSHLAEQISRLATAKIRIDGIEASGLNEDLSLKVSRTPRYGYLARSTPELIVTRLLKASNDNYKSVYERMLSSLQRKEA